MLWGKYILLLKGRWIKQDSSDLELEYNIFLWLYRKPTWLIRKLCFCYFSIVHSKESVVLSPSGQTKLGLQTGAICFCFITSLALVIPNTVHLSWQVWSFYHSLYIESGHSHCEVTHCFVDWCFEASSTLWFFWPSCFFPKEVKWEVGVQLDTKCKTHTEWKPTEPTEPTEVLRSNHWPVQSGPDSGEVATSQSQGGPDGLPLDSKLDPN